MNKSKIRSKNSNQQLVNTSTISVYTPAPYGINSIGRECYQGAEAGLMKSPEEQEGGTEGSANGQFMQQNVKYFLFQRAYEHFQCLGYPQVYLPDGINAFLYDSHNNFPMPVLDIANLPQQVNCL